MDFSRRARYTKVVTLLRHRKKTNNYELVRKHGDKCREVEDSEQVQRLASIRTYPASNTKEKQIKQFQPNNLNIYTNQNHAQHDAFRSDVESAIQRNGMNSVGMINDTKRKEIIDGYALNKLNNVKPFLTKGRGESQSK